MKYIRTLGFLAACGVLPAQQTMAPAPPNPAGYQAALGVLRNDTGSGPASAAAAIPPLHRSKRKAAEISGTITTAVPVFRELPLPPNAQAALSLSESAQGVPVAPGLDNEGRVLYVYGKGLPVVVCALLQVCEVDLEPGEQLKKDSLEWGDNRFLVGAHTAGSGPKEFAYLVLKPTEPRLDTTVSLATTKRTYYLRLMSTGSGEHMSRVAFSYPEEEAANRKAEEDAKEAQEAAEKAAVERLAKLDTAKPLRHWRYSVKLHGKDAQYLRPVSIGDDGIHTHIRLTDTAHYRGLPEIEISDSRGPLAANRHWEGSDLVVDAIFAHGCLLSGVGRHQQRACITNEELKDDGNH